MDFFEDLVRVLQMVLLTKIKIINVGTGGPQQRQEIIETNQANMSQLARTWMKSDTWGELIAVSFWPNVAYSQETTE